MVKRHEFDTREEYLEEQINTTRRKVRKGKANLSTTRELIQGICDHYRGYGFPLLSGICHGVRTGEELDIFEEVMGGYWIGTEVTPELCDGERIICHDFGRLNRSWKYGFDIVYSNSLDHARDPVSVLRIWLKQLSGAGVLYVEHHRHMQRLSKRGKADCLGATRKEYREFITAAGGTIEGEINIFDPPDRKPSPLERTVIAATYCGC